MRAKPINNKISTDFNNDDNIVLQYSDAIYGIVLALLTAIWMELFYRMAVNFNGNYPSDVKYYVTIAANREAHYYRLLGFVFDKLYHINNTLLEIPVYMALVVTFTIIAAFMFMSYFCKDDGINVSRANRQFLSVIAIFTGAIYLPGIHEYYYKQCWPTYAWQSPTTQSMMVFGAFALLAFIKMYNDYETRVDPKLWVSTTICATLSSYAKPSLIIDLIPAMIILFLMELFTAGRGNFKTTFTKLFIMGLSLVPAALLLLNFKVESFDNDSSTGMTFDITHVFTKYDSLILTLLCSLAFPLLVYLFNYRKLKDRKYKVVLMIFIIGVLQWALFIETGRRANAGNFGWGKMAGMHFLFISSLVLAAQNYHDKDFMKENRGGSYSISGSGNLLAGIAYCVSAQIFLFGSYRTWIFFLRNPVRFLLP